MTTMADGTAPLSLVPVKGASAAEITSLSATRKATLKPTKSSSACYSVVHEVLEYVSPLTKSQRNAIRTLQKAWRTGNAYRRNAENEPTTHFFVLLMNRSTFRGDNGRKLESEVRAAMLKKIKILLVHIVDEVPFGHVVERTARDLVQGGLYRGIAVDFHTGQHGQHLLTSAALFGKALGAHSNLKMLSKVYARSGARSGVEAHHAYNTDLLQLSGITGLMKRRAISGGNCRSSVHHFITRSSRFGFQSKAIKSKAKQGS